MDCGSKLSCPQDKMIKKIDFKTLFSICLWRMWENLVFFREIFEEKKLERGEKVRVLKRVNYVIEFKISKLWEREQ